MKKLLNRFKDPNKWSYMMNIAFGLCILMITLYFQFGKTIMHIDGYVGNIITPETPFYMDSGYITESRLWVRIIEGAIGLGLVGLGIERMIHRQKKKKKNSREK